MNLQPGHLYAPGHVSRPRKFGDIGRRSGSPLYLEHRPKARPSIGRCAYVRHQRTASLTLSGLVFTGWWQGFFLELGVGLLIAGIVDIAILGALHGLIEGDGETAAIHQLIAAMNRVETLLKTPGAAAGQSASTGTVG